MALCGAERSIWVKVCEGGRGCLPYFLGSLKRLSFNTLREASFETECHFFENRRELSYTGCSNNFFPKLARYEGESKTEILFDASGSTVI